MPPKGAVTVSKVYLVKWADASMKVSSLAHATKLMGILQAQDPRIVVSISLVL